MPWYRIATAGATTDGRVISADWLTQMAKNFDPAKYGCRVNLEHIKGVLPDSPFKAYGDVTALKAEEGDDGKQALFAEISPTDELKAMVEKRQKVYTSIEVDPDFADTGEAYLVGLAVTDTPASLGSSLHGCRQAGRRAVRVLRAPEERHDQRLAACRRAARLPDRGR